MDQDIEQQEKEMDSYTEEVLARGVSRRSFLSRTALGAAGMGLLGVAGFGSKNAGGRTERRGPGVRQEFRRGRHALVHA